jgi:hypothetical protein
LALKNYTRQEKYLLAMKAGAPRIGLDGKVAGVVDKFEAAFAVTKLQFVRAAKVDETEEESMTAMYEKLNAWNEEAAKTMWCPMMLHSAGRCIASDCAMWRWAHDGTDYAEDSKGEMLGRCGFGGP